MTDKLKEAARKHGVRVAKQLFENEPPDSYLIGTFVSQAESDFLSGATSPEAEEYWRGKYNTKVIAFLEAHLKWEADLINEDKFWWPNADKDTLRGPIYDKFLDLQQMRNELLAMFRKEKA